MQDTRSRATTPGAFGMLGDLGVPGLDMPGSPAPPSDLREPGGDYRVEVRAHIQPTCHALASTRIVRRTTITSSSCFSLLMTHPAL
jgi:hypothetical protein